MVNCNNIRKITINQILPDGEVVTSVIYFDMTSGDQVSANSVRKCNNIEALSFSCAITCNPSSEPVDNNCWLTPSEECWLTSDGNYWELG